ncbi:ligand-binding SRPBCC domain-containing protein [Granulicella aggregans]|uniref:Ligand-binding SRPBCC domain-containing protein n=1 Tax=Granulicella aggregans TaxID=474949 RepID=A0A7W8E4P6_9BACT|nr:hypothetical protein [Granulicella aggregans]MBB5057380.1 ligand-binding SRPBCC domain-containing protein [Granulicella aggregans]
MGKQFTLRDSITIHAPIDRCFALSTSIEVVALTLAMRPVSYTPEARLSGMIAANDRLLWRGWKFGLPQLHETLITAFDPPHFFQDTMGRGRFATFQHDHHFTPLEDGASTLLEDELRFSMPFGAMGALVGAAIMVPHIKGLLRRRFALLKRLAETDAWKTHLPA